MNSKYVLFALIALVLAVGALSSCDEGCGGEFKEGVIKENTALGKSYEVVSEDTLWHFEEIPDSELSVFVLQYSASDCPLVSDDEYSHYIKFHLNVDNTNEFNLEGKQLVENNTYIQRFGAQHGSEMLPITGGTITGEKVSEDSWHVTLEVIYEEQGYEIPVKDELAFSYKE